MKTTSILKSTFALSLALCASSFADGKQVASAKINEELKLQEQRGHELEDIAKWDEAAVKSLREHASNTRKHAQDMKAKAKEFNDAAATLPDGDAGKKELQGYAKELDVYAAHDEDFAKQRDKLAADLQSQAKAAHDGAHNHFETVKKMKASLDKLSH